MKRFTLTDRPRIDPQFEMVVANDSVGIARSALPGAIYQACPTDLQGLAAVLRAADGTHDVAQLLTAFGSRYSTLQCRSGA